MNLIRLILILAISKPVFGQEKYIGLYKDRFSESIELKTDYTFLHKWQFDLSKSWTIGKWNVKNDTIYLTAKSVLDTLQIRNSENEVIRDSLVLSSDQQAERIEQNELIASNLSSGGQNRYEPPNKVFWKKNKLFRINENGTLDLRKVKSFWTDKKYKTYFRKEIE